MKIEEIGKLIKLLDQSSLTRLTYSTETETLQLSKKKEFPAPAGARDSRGGSGYAGHARYACYARGGSTGSGTGSSGRRRSTGCRGGGRLGGGSQIHPGGNDLPA